MFHAGGVGCAVVSMRPYSTTECLNPATLLGAHGIGARSPISQDDFSPCRNGGSWLLRDLSLNRALEKALHIHSKGNVPLSGLPGLSAPVVKEPREGSAAQAPSASRTASLTERQLQCQKAPC